MASPENKVTNWSLSSISKNVGTMCRSPSYERFLEGGSCTLHVTRRTPHGASRLVQATPIWLVKTRRAPSRHSRGARVYDRHAQTEYTPLCRKNYISTPPRPSNAYLGAWRGRWRPDEHFWHASSLGADFSPSVRVASLPAHCWSWPIPHRGHITTRQISEATSSARR